MTHENAIDDCSVSNAYNAQLATECEGQVIVGMDDLLRDAYTAEPGVAALQLNDRRDEFRRRVFRAGFAATVRGGKEQTIFVIDQRLVEFEQRCRLDERAKFLDLAGTHEQRGQPDKEAIERGQVRSAPSGSITDQKLMLEQKRLCGDRSYATRAQKLREGYKHVDGEDEEFPHGANGTTTAIVCKTAQRRRISSYCEFATHRFQRPITACNVLGLRY